MKNLLFNVERFGVPVDSSKAASAAICKASADGVGVAHSDRGDGGKGGISFEHKGSP